MDSWYDIEEDKARKEFMEQLTSDHYTDMVQRYLNFIAAQRRMAKEKQVKTILNKWKDDRLHNNRNNRDGVDSLRP